MTLAQITPDYTREQLDIIKNTVAAGTTDLEFALFMEVCRTVGLSPLQKQVYAIKRGQGDRAKMTIQTGIDGYRLIAARTGTHMGTTDAEFGPLTQEGFPEWARVIVRRLVHGQVAEFPATARWSEYVQEKDEWVNRQPTGKKVVSDMWRKMPHTMLGKCAEALALRKAFPAELSGVYTSEEMQQADTPAPAQERQEDPTLKVWVDKTHAMRDRVVKAFPEAAGTITELLESLPGWENSLDTARGMYESVRDYGLELNEKKAAPVNSDTEVMATDEQVKALVQYARSAGCTTQDERASLYAYLNPSAQGSTKSLTEQIAAGLIETLSGMSPDERKATWDEAKKAAKGQLL